MRRLVFGSLNRFKPVASPAHIRQRFMALFFLVGFLAGVLTPTASAYAQFRPDPSNPNIKKDEAAKKPMKQNYTSGMQPLVASQKAAADAMANSNGPVEELKKKTNPIGEILGAALDKPKVAQRELIDKRTATSTVSVNQDGTLTEKQFFGPKFYKKAGKWETIDTSLIEDKNAGDSKNSLGKAWGNVRSWLSEDSTYMVKANDWQARFAPADAEQGLLRIGKGNGQVSFVAVNAKKDVKPVIAFNKDGYQTVHYYDLWPGVNVEYVIESAVVKENVVIKDKNAANQVAFKVVGAGFEERIEKRKVGNHEITTKAHVLKGALNDEFAIAPANLILNKYGFVSDQSVFSQSFKGDTVTLSVDRAYLQSLPADAFPVVIDPSTFYDTFGTRAGGNYVSLKSDGYVCYSNVCNPYAGSLYDTNNTLRYWRSAVHAPYSQLNDPNKTLSNATLHLKQRSNESFWTGTFDPHTYYVGHAACINGFHCLNGPHFNAAGVISGSGSIDVTNIYQSRIGQGDFGAWLLLGGEDGTTNSFKNFDPGTGPYNSGSYVSFTYNGPPSAPNVQLPTANQVYVDPQPSFRVGYAQNPNGSAPLKYQMRVSSGPGGAGFLIASPVLSSTQWTMPDGMLQDGSTYYIQARSFDSISNLYSSWGSSIPFRIDMRTGNDSSQTYTTLGPVNVNLATGNVSTSASSHSSTALGGSLGIGLSYNTPLKSRNGLVGEYWNVAANYSGGAPTSTPVVTRVDQNVNFDWDSGSPSSGVIGDDWYYARWSGYFIAPTTGSYQFGGHNDDTLDVYVNNQQLYSSTGCSSVCYGTSVTLQAGQAVPIRMEYKEAVSGAFVQVYVKGAVDEKIIPPELLRTGVRSVDYKKHGLTGSYYARLDGTNTFSANNYKIMERLDPYLSFNWGNEAPVPEGPGAFLAKWTGYITVPVSGTYTLGSRSDDGSKITVGTANTVALNDWTTQAAPTTPTWGMTNVALTANTPTKITIEYYDEGGPASYEFWAKSAGAGVPEQIVPSNWLSPQAQVLPDGWEIGVDSSGTANYSHLKPSQNNVVLTDSSGGAHEYSWTGTGYKPPVNEDGNLMRNADGTFTLQDADGQTYVFAIDGTLTSVTNSADDRSPAALQYEYQSLSGGPVHIYKIKDGINSSRNLTLYYSGQTQCGSAPVGFDANAPTGMLCAAQTNDGRTTNFYYIQGQLARVAMPGNSFVDYQYETVMNSSNVAIGSRLVSVRDALANDAIAAGVRVDDNNVKTQIGYDVVGRAVSVTQPAATANANRLQYSIEYLPGAKSYVDENGSLIPSYAGMTLQHVVGAAEPKGYMRRIKYDDLYRTIENTDISGLSSTTEWDASKDMVYSATDPTGMKSTTVYDDEDRAIRSYGPAPKSWFTDNSPNNQVPQSVYASQVARADTAYDEGITGPEVTYYNYKATNETLFGAPKLHATGFNTVQPGLMSRVWANAPPITVDSGFEGWGMRATGKLRVATSGTYEFHLWHDDGATISIDDQQVAGDWNSGAHRRNDGTRYLEAGKVYRFNLQYFDADKANSALELFIRLAPAPFTDDFSAILKPDYNLVTSAKSYDSTLGDSTATVNYGNTPELGLPQSVTADSAGLNLTSTAAYEQQGVSGTYLRPTKQSRPGDSSTNPASAYTYYAASDTRDNPCTVATESYMQAGLAKIVANASPDNGLTPGRLTETVYDDAGRIVAVRTNSDGWTCTTYDSRGRVTQTIIPAVGSEAGRTITNNHAVYGDPTMTSADDGSGENLTQIDLLGRTIYYHDAHWNETWTGYDSLGRIAWRSSDVGDESFVYDSFSRLTQHKLDNVTYAVVSYDQYGRTLSIEYPNAANQKMVVSRDALGRVTGQVYYAGGSQTPGGNLVANPSVEQVSSGDPTLPEDWQNNAWGTNTPDFTYLNEGYTGNKSVKTELTSRTNGDAKWSFDPVAVTPNTSYTFKDYYKSNISTEAVVQYIHQNQSVTYEWLGNVNASSNWSQTNYNFTTPATVVQATVLHIVSNVGWLITDDVEMYANSSGNQTVIASDEVVRSQTGRIVSGTENGQSKAYSYDKAGRLTSAVIGSNSYSYGYGAQDSSCAGGTNTNSGKNFNRTSQTINSVTTNYCYDYADRLTSSSDPLANNAQYDSHGNMTRLGSGSTPLRMYYDSSDRNWGFEQYDSGGNGTAAYYSRDVQGRINYRATSSIANSNWTTTDEKWYGFSGNSDAPSIVRNAAWNVVEKYLSLPGGVLMTVRPPQSGNANKVYSLPNLHGSIMATTDALGTLTGTFRYDPFGNKVSSTLPDNTTAGSVLGWAGKFEKITEANLTLTPIQMGARVYLPTIGRFAQVDPIPGGNANDYVYAVDPVNSNDFSGKFLQGGAGAGFLQPAAGAGRVQPAAPAPYYQPAASTRAYQNAWGANLPIVRTPTPAAAPTRNNSTRMPAATVEVLPFIANIKQGSPYAPSGNVARENFNYAQAGGSALAWSGGVATVGFYTGAYFGGPAGGGLGFIVGGLVGGVVGFFIGGYSIKGHDVFDALPNELYLPRPR